MKRYFLTQKKKEHKKRVIPFARLKAIHQFLPQFTAFLYSHTKGKYRYSTCQAESLTSCQLHSNEQMVENNNSRNKVNQRQRIGSNLLPKAPATQKSVINKQSNDGVKATTISIPIFSVSNKIRCRDTLTKNTFLKNHGKNTTQNELYSKLKTLNAKKAA